MVKVICSSFGNGYRSGLSLGMMLTCQGYGLMPQVMVEDGLAIDGFEVSHVNTSRQKMLTIDVTVSF